MIRERLIAWNLEIQGAHHTLEAALNAARVSVSTGAPLDSLAANLILRCRGFCAALDDHHRSEDTALFPRLLAETPELSKTMATLRQDHRALAGLLADFEESLAGLCAPDDAQRDQLDAHLDRIEAVMKNHFSDEERHLHTALRKFKADPSEKDALLGSARRNETSPRPPGAARWPISSTALLRHQGRRSDRSSVGPRSGGAAAAANSIPSATVHTAAVTCDVDSFVTELGEGWQRAVCGQLLEDIRAAAPFSEHLKWSHPYFELDNAAVLKWFCAKEWINVYFFRGRELPDPRRLFQPSENSKMLTVKLTQTTDLVRAAFRDLLREAAALAHV